MTADSNNGASPNGKGGYISIDEVGVQAKSPDIKRSELTVAPQVA